jgi:zinc D-Ala-D-Ala carboxypeptidase
VNDTPSQASIAGRVDEVGKTVSKYVAIIAALISVAVPLTEWLRGISNQKIKETEQRSVLAVTYLDKIAAKETSNPDRIMYLSALSRLDNHPLQTWATEQLEIQRNLTKELNAIIKKGSGALEASSEAQEKIQKIQSDIDIIQFKMNNAGTPDQVEPLQKQFAELTETKNKLRASLLAQVKEAASAGAEIAAATGDRQNAADFISAVRDLQRAAITSETAKNLGIDNTPTAEAEVALNFVLETIAQPVEKHFGKRIEIVSGYRAPGVNRAVGGSGLGAHSLGQAIDIRIPDVPLISVACWIRDNLDYDQLILESASGVVHIATKKVGNRHQVMTQPGGPSSPPTTGLECPPK